jgi:SAM-dependent methyltransferase
MRRDYILAAAGGTAAESVGAWWDAQWHEGDEGAAPAALRGREEYRFMRARVPALVAGGLDVLDCGCGRGDWTRLFAAQGHRAVGIDIARDAVRRLRERFGDMFRAADFRSTGLPDAAFDLAINWGGVEHFEEGPLPALVEAFRVLRPGGHLFVSTPCHNARGRLLDWRAGSAAGARPSPDHRFYQYRFTPDELASHLRDAGFTDVQTRVIAGEQGMTRAFEHELRALVAWLPARMRRGLARVGGALLRPWVGHMVVAGAVRPRDHRDIVRNATTGDCCGSESREKPSTSTW